MTSSESLQLLRLFQRVAPASFLERICREQDFRYRRGVYSVAVVVWLMIWQRLQGNRSLVAAVQCLIHGGAGGLGGGCKRWTDDQVSSATGGDFQAPPEFPKLIGSQVSERIVEQIH